jgi:DNA-directed RNA polymerase subunit RPC12/RpoP
MNPIRCPNCGKRHLDFYGEGIISYRCRNCKQIIIKRIKSNESGIKMDEVNDRSMTFTRN